MSLKSLAIPMVLGLSFVANVHAQNQNSRNSNYQNQFAYAGSSTKEDTTHSDQELAKKFMINSSLVTFLKDFLN